MIIGGNIPYFFLIWLYCQQCHQFMIYHRKRLILKRLNHLLRIKRMKTEFLVNQKHKLLSGSPINDDDDYSTQPSQLPLEFLQFMSPTQRKKLRKSYPDLPQYMFMDQKQKQQYFDSKAAEYIKKLEGQKQRMCKTKKIVKFAKKFEVKPFSDKQKVGIISKTNSFQDSYQNEHYS